MRILRAVLLALAVSSACAMAPLVPATAGESDPLFVNLTTDEGFRTMMAMRFAIAQANRGHPLTLFLNDKGIYLVSKARASAYPDQQKLIADMIDKGAAVIACPQCMKQFDVPERDLLPGVTVGAPEVTGGALFRDGTKTLSW